MRFRPWSPPKAAIWQLVLDFLTYPENKDSFCWGKGTSVSIFPNSPNLCFIYVLLLLYQFGSSIKSQQVFLLTQRILHSSILSGYFNLWEMWYIFEMYLINGCFCLILSESHFKPCELSDNLWFLLFAWCSYCVWECLLEPSKSIVLLLSAVCLYASYESLRRKVKSGIVVMICNHSLSFIQITKLQTSFFCFVAIALH